MISAISNVFTSLVLFHTFDSKTSSINAHNIGFECWKNTHLAPMHLCQSAVYNGEGNPSSLWTTTSANRLNEAGGVIKTLIVLPSYWLTFYEHIDRAAVVFITPFMSTLITWGPLKTASLPRQEVQTRCTAVCSPHPPENALTAQTASLYLALCCSWSQWRKGGGGKPLFNLIDLLRSK